MSHQAAPTSTQTDEIVARRSTSHWLLLIRLSWIWAGVAVALGAFGAHGLQSQLPVWYPDADLATRRADNWETAVLYQMFHALGALIVSIWLTSTKGLGPRWGVFGAWCLLLGNAIFSGCLYLLVLTDLRILGAVVPLGGVLQLAGWFMIGISPMTSHESRYT